MEGLPSVKATSSEKEFIEYLISYIVSTNPGDLQTNLNKVTSDLQDNYDTKHNLNLYRKSFGNIKDVVKPDATKMVFKLEGTAFRFEHPSSVARANECGVLTPAAWAKYQEGRSKYLTKHLTIAKNNKMNVCKNCEQKYFVNASASCSKGETHEAQYDFTKDEDVLKCEI